MRYSSARLLVLCVALTSPISLGATFNVTRGSDPVPDGCIPTDCSLREAIIAANEAPGSDLILLGTGTYLINLVGSDTSDDTGDLDVRDSVTIRGQGNTATILDGQNLGRVLHMHGPATINLESMRLVNGNSSIATNGTINGGGVFSEETRLNATGVVFEGNFAEALGGALRAIDNSVVNLVDCAFIDNTADFGGAIVLTDGELTATRTEFDRNDAGTANGGALYMTGSQSSATFNHGTFRDNTAASGGGAIYHLGKDLLISDSVFSANVSDGNGASVASPGSAHQKLIEITRSTFLLGVADSGGAISNSGDNNTMRIWASTFRENSALSGDGGALHLTGGSNAITNATFNGNSASQGGGGISNFFSDLTLRHATFSGNSASRGAAVNTGGSTPTTSTTWTNSVVDGDCDATNVDTVTSLGGNLEGPGNTCQLGNALDLVNRTSVQLGLLALADNGGPTQTQGLGPASEARDHGVTGVCNAVHIDQRFGIRDPSCDSGAVEQNAIADDFIFADNLEL